MKLKKISQYLNTQGVTACKRFKIKKDGNFIETNTLLLTFNTTTLPKSQFFTELYRLKYTFQILCGVSTVRGLDIMKTVVRKHLDQYVKCGMGEFDHHTNACKNEAKCVNRHKNHQSKSNQCEI